MICELHSKFRTSFIIVCGIWCDDVKPPMNIFLRPFTETLRQLYNKGSIIWKHPESGLEIQSSVVAPLICCDAPIRAELQNIKSHNAHVTVVSRKPKNFLLFRKKLVKQYLETK